jgi:hypothetical protein
MVSDNSEIPIIWLMMKVVPRMKVLLFTRKTFINERGISQEYV